MIRHYIKIAFRNLWKYKTQSVISIIGLAVGFTCFALSALWIRYEMTYDSFRKDSKQIYLVQREIKTENSGFSRRTAFPLAADLKNTFPEIEAACNMRLPGPDEMKVDGVDYDVFKAGVDSSFLNVFEVKLIEGNWDFIVPGSWKVAVSPKIADTIWPTENPLGKSVSFSGREYAVCAIVETGSEHSNYPINVFIPNDPNTNWFLVNWQTLVKLKPNVNVSEFEKKLSGYKTPSGERSMQDFIINPITKIRYNKLDDSSRESLLLSNQNIPVSFKYILLFAIIGGMVIICSLINYFILYISRFPVRRKELALRITCGASMKSLFFYLSVEFLLTILCSALIGMLLFSAIRSPFQELTGIPAGSLSVYMESAVYIAAVVIVAWCLFSLVLIFLQKRSLNISIKKGNKNAFRRIAIALQLIISIGFIFCTIVMMKQLYLLHNADLGFEYKNTANISVYPTVDFKVLAEQIEAFPEVETCLKTAYPLFPRYVSISDGVEELDGKPVTDSGDLAMIETLILSTSDEFWDFYRLELLSGNNLSDADEGGTNILINEALAKKFDSENPIGKTVKVNYFNEVYHVKGVVKNILAGSPTQLPRPAIFKYERKSDGIPIFKFKDGSWKSLKSKIEQLMQTEYPHGNYSLYNVEESYNRYMASENALLKILAFTSLVCILIAVFGLFSIVSLSCEERRKEIAIRKINGAKVSDILNLFFKEYVLLLFIGTIIAFPVAYKIMKTWIEQYVMQTSVSWWIYVLILFGLAFIIVLSVGWKIDRTARQNPAEVLKMN